MYIEDNLIRNEEKMIFLLRSLYSQSGYTGYKMSKFEEYDLYVRNKDFLVSEGIITFTDTTGKLMALRPDVTLSIVKNSRYVPGTVRKLYYDEKVYRISDKNDTFSEITQMGLEALGDIDDRCVAEVLQMALKSLARISKEYVLILSHPGLIAALLDEMDLSLPDRESMISFIAGKSRHEREKLAKEKNVSPAVYERLEKLLSLSGDAVTVLDTLTALLPGEKEQQIIKDLRNTLQMVDRTNIRIDFSVPGNMRYYSGPVFAGYVRGIPTAVLSGGRYDLLVRRMGKQGGAIGFAVYLDLIDSGC